ncbi:hypothetical protein CGRA01v4_13420 [Colletotrichum graminicola]|nr:hypothetical protein CGRA01v4_13420 [Colletotrichum graminicola]
MSSSDRDRAHAMRRPYCAVCIAGSLGRVSPRHKKTHMRHHWSGTAWGGSSIPIKDAQGSPESGFSPTWDLHCGEGHGESVSLSSSHRQRDMGVPCTQTIMCNTARPRRAGSANREMCLVFFSRVPPKSTLEAVFPICRPPTRTPSGGGGDRHVIYYLVELADALVNPAPYVPEGHN